ncbi:hypothetical protein ABZ519_05960 [Streptomyces collinus]|uniref:hypothetical protein n=1 Tax=Streptomyces collinus TaxID=42684 RepID=UPI0033FBE487
MSGLAWAALATGVVGLGVFLVRRLAARRGPTLEDVVADGLADVWAHRLAVPRDQIRPALSGDDDGSLRDRIGDLVGKVSCTFRQAQGIERRHLVEVVVGCDYRDGGSEQVMMRVPWRRVPSAVRAELLRARTGEAARIWTPAGSGLV